MLLDRGEAQSGACPVDVSRRRGASLLSVLDKTRTAMGGRMLRRWIDQPLLDVDEIRRRLDAVEYLLQNALVRAELRRR